MSPKAFSLQLFCFDATPGDKYVTRNRFVEGNERSGGMVAVEGPPRRLPPDAPPVPPLPHSWKHSTPWSPRRRMASRLRVFRHHFTPWSPRHRIAPGMPCLRRYSTPWSPRRRMASRLRVFSAPFHAVESTPSNSARYAVFTRYSTPSNGAGFSAQSSSCAIR